MGSGQLIYLTAAGHFGKREADAQFVDEECEKEKKEVCKQVCANLRISANRSLQNLVFLQQGIVRGYNCLIFKHLI